MTVGFITDLSERDFWFAQQHGLQLEVTVNPPFGVLDSLTTLLDFQQRYAVAVASCGMWGAEYFAEDPQEAEAARARVSRLIDFAAALGAPTCCIGGGGETEGLSLQDHVNRFLPLLREWIEYAESKNVRLAIYNCHWANFAYKPDSWELIWDALGDSSLGIKFDPSHPFYDGRDYLRELMDWGDKVTHVHVKDTLKIGTQIIEDVPAGMGNIEWGKLVAILHHHGYKGCLSMEPHSKTWHGHKRYDGILIGVRHIRQFLP